MQFAKSYRWGRKVATIVACQTFMRGPIEAAIVNAELAHSDETDDYHSMGERIPGCSIVPGDAGDLCEQFDIDGMTFVRAAWPWATTSDCALVRTVGRDVHFRLEIPTTWSETFWF